MSELSAKSFLGLVQKSGVVPAERLKQALAELSKQAAGKPVHLDQLTQFLIGEGLITQWHYDKLLTRKYKGFFVGQYKLLSLLGTGGMSTVYLAEHTLSGQRRAIKVLPRARVNDKSYLDRFLREGRAAASLSHPNIVRIYDLANEEDVYYMVMEYVPGVDLHQKIQQEGPAPLEDALRYLEQAAAGLAHAHGKRIVHRDIKPANLLLTNDGTVKLLDLGLALLREDQESLTLLHNEKVMGTADYLAPEQAINSHNVDPRADIYSLGCTFYYLLTGQPPFPDGTIAQRIAMHQSREPKPIRELRPDCPPLVEVLCQRMMKKAPEDRLQSCERIIQAVEKCRQQLGTVTGPPARVEPVSSGANEGIKPTASGNATQGRPSPPPIPTPSIPEPPSPVTAPPQAIAAPPQAIAAPPQAVAKPAQRKDKWQGEPTPQSREPISPSSKEAVSPRAAGSPGAATSPSAAKSPGAAKSPSAAGPSLDKSPAKSAQHPGAGKAAPLASKAASTAARDAATTGDAPGGPPGRKAVSAGAQQGASPAVASVAGKATQKPSTNPQVAIPGSDGSEMASAVDLSAVEVGELAALPGNRARKRVRASAFRTNLVVGAIVLVCFLVLVGMMIFLARMFGT
jgi:serine/threonine-protein kinase